MALRPGLLVVLLSAFALVPSAAYAASKPPSVRVLDCDTEGQSATFRSTMRTVPEAKRLAMRFTLQARSEDQPAWAAIRTPGFDVWISSKRGRSGFSFDKVVEGLPAPGEYRVVVRYRWRDADDMTLLKARRTSRVCEQPDPRPDLQPTDLIAVADGFQLTLSNEGAGPAPAVAVRLDAGGASVTQTAPALAEGESAKVRFDGLACTPGSTVVATVDPAGEVDEADEGGNILTVGCPSPAS